MKYSNTTVLLLVSLLIITLLVLGSFFLPKNKTLPNFIQNLASNRSTNGMNWTFDGDEWKSSNVDSNCAEEIELIFPTDISKVTSVLYPGQIRGNDYKAHGGFRFDNNKNNNVLVKMPIDAKLWRASMYEEEGEVQIMIDLISDCGVMVKFDHLKTLSSNLEAIVKSEIPLGKNGDSRTTTFKTNLMLKKSDIIATEVGHSNPLNVGFDLGIYDLRSKNLISTDTNWRKRYATKSETAYFGICWLDNFEKDISQKLKLIPGGGTEGKVSDYCN